MHFLICLLTSFNRCFPSLGVVLLPTQWIFWFPCLPLRSPHWIQASFPLLLHRPFLHRSFRSYSCRDRHVTRQNLPHRPLARAAQVVSITFSVCFPFAPSRLCSTAASTSWQFSSFEMTDMSCLTCPTCKPMEPASSFAVRCPRVLLTCFFCRLHIVLHLDFWELSVWFFCFRFCFLAFSLCCCFFVSAVFPLLWFDSLSAASAFSWIFSMISSYFFRAQASHHQCLFQFCPLLSLFLFQFCLFSFYHGHLSSE